MRWRLLFPCTVVLFICFASCTTSAGEEKKISDTLSTEVLTTTGNRDSLSKPLAASNPGRSPDTVSIEHAGAVFFSPDSAAIEKRKKEVGEEDFYIGADDYMYYMHLSHDYLEKQDLPITMVKTNQVIKFESPGQSEVIRLATLPELWGVYLFQPGKPVHFADILDMEAEYKKYFGKQ